MTGWLNNVGLALGVAAALYVWLAVWASWPRGSRRRIAPPQRAVTLLKPLYGAEPELAAQLRSFCQQDYGELQVIFGLHSDTDPALPVVRALQREFPTRSIDVVIDARRHGSNAKVSNLLNMLPHARHEWLVLSDSDIRVTPDYLTQLLAPLADPAVGLVTCAYAARAQPGLPSALGALFINDWFMPQVQLAARFGARAFVSGATIALSREVLSRSGGFEALADQLADDFKLGEQVRALGLHVALAPLMVQTQVAEVSLGSWWRHCLRWMRTVYSIQPLGYAFCFLTIPLPLALLCAILTHFSSNALILLGVTVVGRLVLHFRPRERALRPDALQTWWLLPHELLLLALWCWSFCNRKVTWRDERFDVAPDGSLQRL